MNRTAQKDADAPPVAAAHESKAWPFEEARKVLSRLKRIAEADRRHHLRDRLRAVGAAAYRHVRRGRAHHHGAPRLPRADRGQDRDPADLLLRRHGRLAQGARQRPQQGDAGRASRQAADAGARPVRRPSELRPSQQCAAESLSRHVRLRLRVPLGDRVLHQRPLRRDAAQGARALRRDQGRDPADARARTPRHL